MRHSITEVFKGFSQKQGDFSPCLLLRNPLKVKGMLIDRVFPDGVYLVVIQICVEQLKEVHLYSVFLLLKGEVAETQFCHFEIIACLDQRLLT